ncbi:MAG: hypothetical protein HY765_06905, partial [Rhodomicrobium sp.]|nr:hypothetical protein [Rhodomicrobium sp.]
MSLEPAPISGEADQAGPALGFERALGEGRGAIGISFAGLALTLDGSGAAYIGAYRTLIVSDLHLEKGS